MTTTCGQCGVQGHCEIVIPAGIGNNCRQLCQRCIGLYVKQHAHKDPFAVASMPHRALRAADDGDGDDTAPPPPLRLSRIYYTHEWLQQNSSAPAEEEEEDRQQQQQQQQPLQRQQPTEVMVRGEDQERRWVFNGKTGSRRTVHHTAEWDSAGIAWTTGVPHIKRPADAGKLMRKNIHGYYVVGKEVIEKETSRVVVEPRKRRASKRLSARRHRGSPPKKRQKKTLDAPTTTITTTKPSIRTPPLSKECSICMDAEPTVASSACGHLCMCEGCSKKVTECPVCRKGFAPAQLIRIYCC